MTLLAPLFFQLGLLAAGVAVALHFIVTRQPPSSLLPTARFVPRDTVQVTTVSRPRDLLLLLLRVIMLLLIGLAFARPILVPGREPVARIVLADVSSAVHDIAEVRDSVRALLRPQDVLITFDSAARAITPLALDTITRSNASARLSPAFVSALRTAADLRAHADSIEIVVVSPLRARAIDGATLEVRELWPGPIRLIDVAARVDSSTSQAVEIRAAEDDVVRITLPDVSGEAGARLVRGELSAEDSAWAAAGRTLVHWPTSDAPRGFVRRSTPDTAGAAIMGEAALVFPLERAWQPADSTARVVARWIDGEPAAIEQMVGNGCIRAVSVPVPERGDLVLRPSFARFAHALVQPCSALTSGPGLDADTRAAIGGDGPIVHRDLIPAPDDIPTPIVPWLLAAALLLALLELRVRRSRAITHEHGEVIPEEMAA